MVRARSSARSAVSLVELIIVIGIVLVLAGVLAPVLADSKRAGLWAVDMSNMRQISAAMHIYEENQGEMALGTAPLVYTNLIPKEICISGLDRTRIGLANVVGEELIANNPEPERLRYLIRPYKSSYLGYWDYGWTRDKFRKEVEGYPAPGVLISTVESDFKKHLGHTVPASGKYLRLLLDGSVVVRQYSPLDMGAGGKAHSVCWLFADYDAAAKAKHIASP